MSEQKLISIVTKQKARRALESLAAIPHTDRRPHAKAVAKLYSDHVLFGFEQRGDKATKPRDRDAVIVGLYATATLSELKKLGFVPMPASVPIQDVFRGLELDFAQGLVDHLVEQNPHAIGNAAPLWQDGFALRPESDGIILGYYGIWHERWGVDEEVLLSKDVWRFFEVEGGGEFSLANHDKFAKQGTPTWSDRLIGYAEAGKLDRQRLLDASLDALERDFGQYRAGWYSRFHTALAPTNEEIAARADRYLGLLSSSVPPTVSFALKFVQAADKSSPLEPAKLLTSLEPALQARSKGSVLAALKLVDRAYARDQKTRSEALKAVTQALVSEDAGVQKAALDLIERLSDGNESSEQPFLADYVDLVVPSLRNRIAGMAGRTAQPGAHVAAVPVEPLQAVAISPVENADEALSLFLSVLETPRDPFDVERAADSISRFGAELRGNPTLLSPLKKRAGQLWARPGGVGVRAVLALTGRGLCEGQPLAALAREEDGRESASLVDESGLQSLHLARNSEMLDRVLAGGSLPLLSLPGDTSGAIKAADLLDRLQRYAAAGASPGTADLSLALMRLNAETPGSPAGLSMASEPERALAYALGQDVDIGPTPELWAAAWCARRPVREDSRVAGLFGKTYPECGVPAKMTLDVVRKDSKCGAYFWVDVTVPIAPAVEGEGGGLRSLFSRKESKTPIMLRRCGSSFADVAWASLSRPGAPDLLFRQALLHQDVWQKLTDNHTRAYLEPFFRPGPDVSPLGAGVLAYYMAVEDKSVTSLAAEAAAETLNNGRLAIGDFADAIKAFLLSGALPTTRWTKGFAAMAEAGAARHVRETIGLILDFAPEECPRDLGGMLELYYELHVDAGTAPERPETLSCLASLPGGGKTAKFSKKLLMLAKEAA
ncbi:DUF6493 family protein [Roseibium sp.]|uniref:DUF6493 family protein n=1 Tax=Roseibium sp. TaxID=1936156 RepID=UPI003B50E211